MRRRFGMLCMILGALLLAAALLLLAYNQRENERAGREAEAALKEVQAAIAAREAAEKETFDEAAEPESGNKTPEESGAGSGTEVSASGSGDASGTQNAGTGAAADQAASGSAQNGGAAETVNYLGYLSVPDLGLTLPVIADWSYPNLRKAPCRFSGSVQNENLVIVAHNYARHFGNLHKLVAGDTVTFTDMDGTQTVYAVSGVTNIAPDAAAEATNGSSPLTLITCTPGGKMRVSVRCELAE